MDKPGADLVVRTLEIAQLSSDDEFKNIRKLHTLRGVNDRWLFSFLPAGSRSAVFGLHSSSRVHYTGDLWQIFVFQVVVLTGAINLGIFISTFARNEFQMVQFIPLIILPQVFLCGVLWPVEQMSSALQWVAKFLPLTYAVDGLREIMLHGKSLIEVGFDLGILVAFAVGVSIITAFTLRRGAGN